MPPTIEPGAPPTPNTAPARTTSATSVAGARAAATEPPKYARRLSRAIPSVPGLHLGHDLFEQARRIVGPRRTGLTTLYDPLYDDLLSEATLALLEGRDPADAIRHYRTSEQVFGRVTRPLDEAA